MIIRALILDAEKNANQKLRQLLAKEGDIEVLPETPEVDARDQMVCSPDLHVVFVDPQVFSAEQLASLDRQPAGRLPLLVFVTADAQHALAAFDHGAIDYLLKPLQPARLQQTLARLRTRLSETGSSAAAASLKRFVVRTQDRLLVVPADQVDWMESANNYIVLHAGRDTHILRETLSRVERRLPSGRFLRISRFAIINLERVRSFKLEGNGTHTAVMADGAEVPLTRGIREVQDWLETA